MLTAETLQRIRRIELKTRKLVNNVFAGAYHAVFKGRGIVFDTVRPYEPGDDVRDIDWNVTARTGEAHIKRYAEERELSVMLVLDSSASCLFGTVRQPKRDLAAELGAVLAYSAIFNNDKVGLLIFSDRVEHYIPPRKGRNHTLRLIRDLLAVKPTGRGTDISLALRTASRVLKGRAIVFVLSDFLAETDDYYRDLLVLNRKHDVIAVMLNDPREESWPDVGIIGLEDAESDSVIWVDTTSKQWRRQFQQQALGLQAARDDTLSQAGVDRIDIPPDGDYVYGLTLFFQQRAQRAKR